QQVVARVVQSAEIMMESARIASERIFHIHYASFSRNPMTTIESFYRHFGLDLNDNNRRAMGSRLMRARQPENRYTLEEFGLDPAQLCQQFEPYMEEFGVLREVSAWKDTGRRASLAA